MTTTDTASETTATAVDITAELAVILTHDQPTVMAWRRGQADEHGLSPHIKVREAFWDGPKLKIILENGQVFDANFAEVRS